MGTQQSWTRAEREGWAGIWRVPRERRGGCIGFNRAETLCKLAVWKTGLAIAGVKQERGNPVAKACSGVASTATRGLAACPGPAPVQALLHLLILSSFPTGAGPESPAQHTAGPARGTTGCAGTDVGCLPMGAKLRGTGDWGGSKRLLFSQGPPACRGGGCAELPSKGPERLCWLRVGACVRRKGPLRAASALNLKLQTPGEIPARFCPSCSIATGQRVQNL